MSEDFVVQLKDTLAGIGRYWKNLNVNFEQ